MRKKPIKPLVIPMAILLFLYSCDLIIDTTPPTVSIKNPVSGSMVGEVVTVRVDATDNKEVKKVDLFIDEILIASDNEGGYEFEWSTLTESECV